MVYGTRHQSGLVELPHTLELERLPAPGRSPQAAG